MDSDTHNAQKLCLALQEQSFRRVNADARRADGTWEMLPDQLEEKSEEEMAEVEGMTSRED